MNIYTSCSIADLSFWETVTHVGDVVSALVIFAAIFAFLWSRGFFRTAFVLAAAFAGNEITAFVLKYLVARERPAGWSLYGESQFSSFPSGHATVMMFLGGVVIYLIYRMMECGWKKGAAVIAVAVVILLVSLSRLCLNVHYPTDILGGFVIGIVWLGLFAKMSTLPPRN